MIALAYLVEVRIGGVWTAIPNAQVLADGIGSREGGAASAEEPIRIGNATDASATIRVLATTALPTWLGLGLRITITRGIASRTFVGTLDTYRPAATGTVTMDAIGLAELIRRTRVYTPLRIRRGLVTATTAVSVDDPASGNYAGGLLNELWWMAGGRPEAQAAAYPSAAWYYRCDPGPLVDGAWCAGEDGWQETQRIAQDAGGLVYQDRLGVLVYRDTLALVSGTSVISYTDASYQGGDTELSMHGVVTGIVAQITPRRIAATAVVLDDTTPLIVGATGTDTAVLTIERATDAPMVQGSLVLTPDGLIVTTARGERAISGVHYTTTLTHSAQQIVLTITNSTARPLIVSTIRMTATPLIALPERIVRVGTAPHLSIPASPLLHRETQAAERMAILVLIQGAARAVRTLRGMPLDPARTVGEVVTFTSTVFAVTAARHLITELSRGSDGITMDLSLTDLTGIPQQSDYFLVQTGSQAGLTKRVA